MKTIKIMFCLIAAIVMLAIAVSVIAVEAEENPLPLCRDAGGVCAYGQTSDITLETQVPECNSGEIAYTSVSDCNSQYKICCRNIDLSGPDAGGNFVCEGGEAGSTTYNPKKLREIFGTRSELPTENRISATRCSSGIVSLYGTEIPLEYTMTAGSVYGKVTVDSARNMLTIKQGGISGGSETGEPVEEYYQNKPTIFNIVGDTIEVNFANKNAPRVKVSGDGYIILGDVFFACLKKDSNGRAVACSLSAEMEYQQRDTLAHNSQLALKYVNVEGNGFISDSSSGFLAFTGSYGTPQAETIEEMRTRDAIAIPLSNIRNIQLSKPVGNTEEKYPYRITFKTATDGSSAVNYLKIKSSSTDPVNIDAIGSGRERQVLTEEIEISASDTTDAVTIDVTADAARVSEKKQVPFGVDAGCASAAGASRASVNVFVGDKKLAKATICNRVSIIPPLPAGASASLDPAYDRDSGQITLNKETREIKLRRDGSDYGNLELGMLPGYYKYVQTSAYHTDNDADIICIGTPAVISVSNRLGNARLELSDDAVAIKPDGKLFAHLGFGFAAKLCNTDTAKIETFECNAAGECTLDGTRVTGMMEGQQVGPALQTVRQANPLRTANRPAAQAAATEPQVPEEDMPCLSEGGVCADTREMKCFEDETLANEIDYQSRKCRSNPASWYKCCPSGFVASEATQPEESGVFERIKNWWSSLFD